MNYRTIIEEAADRAARHRSSVKASVWRLVKRLNYHSRAKVCGGLVYFPDGRVLDWTRLYWGECIKWF
jgi:hypothetical protein